MIVLSSDSALSFVSAEWLPFAALRCFDPAHRLMDKQEELLGSQVGEQKAGVICDTARSPDMDCCIQTHRPAAWHGHARQASRQTRYQGRDMFISAGALSLACLVHAIQA